MQIASFRVVIKVIFLSCISYNSHPSMSVEHPLIEQSDYKGQYQYNTDFVLTVTMLKVQMRGIYLENKNATIMER